MEDKAYSSRANLDLVASFGGVLYIPFRSHATGKAKRSYVWTKMFHHYMSNREDFMKHYHKRSNAEAVFSMTKRKFMDHVRSRDKVAQFNEVLLKFLCHNVCVVIHEMYAHGIVPKLFDREASFDSANDKDTFGTF